MSNIKSFQAVLKKINEGKYKPIVDMVFPATDVIRAHQRIEDRKNIGKIVLEFS